MIKLEVRSKGENGFRRAGRHWGPDPVEVEVEEEQAKLLLGEAKLFVRRLGGAESPTQPSLDASKPLGLDKPEGDDKRKK